MTPRERRTLLVGGAVVLLAVGVRGLPRVVTHLLQRVATVRERTALATHSEALALEAPVLQTRLGERAHAVVALAPLLVAGASSAEAAATLGGELNALALRHRVAIRRTDAAPDSAAGPFARIEVRLQAEGDLAGISGFVHEVEQGRLLLSFTSVSLQTETPGAPLERLRLEAVVRGWMLVRKER